MIIDFDINEAENGNLIAIENSYFEIKRVFYVYNVPCSEVRGKHAHYNTQQILVCLNGLCKVILDNGKERIEYFLDKKNKAVFVDKMTWDEQIYYSKDTVLLSLCSTKYDPKDYVTDYQEFLKCVKS